MSQPHSPNLNDRPFSYSDGNRYLIIVDGVKAVTRPYGGKPVLTDEFAKAKTFRDLSSVENCVAKAGLANYQYKVALVSDIFEPRYLVSYTHFPKREPRIEYRTDWYLKGVPMEDTYIDLETAKKVLEHYKAKLLEYYYGRIMGLKKIRLD